MIPKERIIAAIEKDEVDQVPLSSPFQGYWALGVGGLSVQDSIDKPEAAAKIQIDISNKCGFDGVETMWDWLSCVELMGCEVRIPEAGSIPTWSHVLEDMDNLDTLVIPDPAKDARFQSSVKVTEIMKQVMSDRFLYMTMVSPFTLVGELRGVEALMLDTFTEPDMVKKVLKVATDVVSEYSMACMETGVDAVILCDPTASGSLISAESFVEFSRPHIMEAGKVVKNANGYLMMHICGDTNDRLEAIADTGADIFSADAMVDLALARKTIMDRQTVLGNVRPAQTLFSSTPDKCYEESLACIEAAGNRGFILGAGCDIAPGTPLENVESMCRAVRIAK